MSDLRELGIEVNESDDGVRYQLPLRPLGQFRPFCLILIVFGMAFTVVPAWGLSGFARHIAGNQGILFAVLTLLFDIPFLLAGLAVIAFGLVIMAGRSMIELTATQLISFEGVGSLGLTRRRPLESLRKFKVERMAAKHNGKPVTEGPLSDLAALIAEFKSAKSLYLAPGYPQSWLRLVAEDIARRRPETGDVLDPEAESTKVQVEVVVHDDPDLADHPEQPAGSRVRVEQQPNSVVLTIPPAGLWRGSNGLFALGLFGCVFTLVFLSIMIGAGFNAGAFVAIPVLLLGASIAILLAAINMGRRRAVLAVVDGALMIYQSGLFCSKRREWPRTEIAAIRTGPSGLSVNDVPVLELQVHNLKGTKVGFLAGRDVDELRWMATVLRRNLKSEAGLE